MHSSYLKLAILCFLTVLAGLPAAKAQDSAGAVMPLSFSNETQRERYLYFSKILRCPMCQNQNLNGSNAGIATDLRAQLHRLVLENKTDEEVIDFMQSRYGNFILYEPPLNKATLVLWFGPVLLLLLGVFVARRLARNNKSEDKAVQLSDQEKRRAIEMLELGSSSTNEKEQATGKQKHNQASRS
ncbi:MAG: cytochrome c-type biogenesis protein CcmH [Pseudomonadales bacterium]